MRKKIYVSGPIAHWELEERQATFEAAAKLLRKHGYEAVNPFENGLSQEDSWRAHMRADIRMLVECDGIYMLRDWEQSKGCKLEHDVATTCGMEVMYEAPTTLTENTETDRP